MTLTTDQAIEELNDMLAFEIDEFGEVPETEEAVFMAIEALKERKKGKWIKGGHCCGETEWICPNCNASEWRTNRVPFCPWCGNPMEVDKG